MDKEEDLEALGEKLYDLIYPKHADMTPKLTGMLLELPGAVISQMLQDEALLSNALEKALAALHPDTSEPPSQADDVNSVSSDSMGEQLYELINLYNTGYTQKITGMLLEQEKKVVLQLLSDPGLLEEKVNMALKSLQGSSCRPSQEETGGSDGCDQDEVEVMGEKLFALVQDIEPTHCADITEPQDKIWIQGAYIRVLHRHLIRMLSGDPSRDAVRNGRRRTAADFDRSDHARSRRAASKARSGECIESDPTRDKLKTTECLAIYKDWKRKGGKT